VADCILDCGGRRVDLSTVAIMGIINVTPDSFSDGGQFFDHNAAIEQGLRLAEEGANLLDIGGESTRPGAAEVSPRGQLDRVLRVISTLVEKLNIPISIDTSDAVVMRAAVAAGAGMINDVRAMESEDSLRAAVDCDVPVCLMHMQGEPRTMQVSPHYDDVVAEVRSFLQLRANNLIDAGLPKHRIVLDPGFGFGKTVQHNLTLLAHLKHLASCGFPVLAGLSRKSMIPKLLGYPTNDRVSASVGLALQAVFRGANILRVHDVKATRQALTVWESVEQAAMTDYNMSINCD
jgi:dihydropteroate synthase